MLAAVVASAFSDIVTSQCEQVMLHGRGECRRTGGGAATTCPKPNVGGGPVSMYARSLNTFVQLALAQVGSPNRFAMKASYC